MPEPPATRQLPLPMVTTPGQSVSPGRRRARRGPRSDPQLWLFAPYMQPELPLIDAPPPVPRPAEAAGGRAPARLPTAVEYPPGDDEAC